MAILRVAQMGHPVLRMICRPVEADEIQTEEFQRLCEDMLDTLDEYDGAGLAAPQVHQPLRVVVLTLSSEQGPEFLVNPVITVLGERTLSTWEGCLSVEGIRGKVERPSHIELRALDRHGNPVHYELEGFPAVVTQHECDHLDGVLYIDKAERATLAFLSEYRRWGPLDELGFEEEEDDLTDEDLDEQHDDSPAAVN